MRAVGGALRPGVEDLEAVHACAKEVNALHQEDAHDDSGAEILVRPRSERSFCAVDPFDDGLCFVDETALFTGEADCNPL